MVLLFAAWLRFLATGRQRLMLLVKLRSLFMRTPVGMLSILPLKLPLRMELLLPLQHTIPIPQN